MSKRDNNIDSSADGLLHDIKYDVLNLTHCLMQLGDDAETRGTDAAREAVTNRKGIDDALEKVDKYLCSHDLGTISAYRMDVRTYDSNES